MINALHTYGEYAGSIDDVIDRHENPEHTPLNYPNFSDKKWRGVFHIHNKALRLIEKKDLENQKLELQEARIHFSQSIHALIHKKEQKHKKRQEEKDTLSTLANLGSGNKKKIIGQLMETDYSDLDDNFLIWLWNSTLYYSKKGITKKQRNDSLSLLDKIRPTMIDRNLPTEGEALKSYISAIPTEEFKAYGRLAHKNIG